MPSNRKPLLMGVLWELVGSGCCCFPIVGGSSSGESGISIVIGGSTVDVVVDASVAGDIGVGIGSVGAAGMADGGGGCIGVGHVGIVLRGCLLVRNLFE